MHHLHSPEQKIDDETINNSCQCGKSEEDNNMFVLQQFSHIFEDIFRTGNGWQLKQEWMGLSSFCLNCNFQHLWSSGVTSVVCSLSMKSIKLVFNKVIPVTKIKINIIFHCKFTELFERNPAVYTGYCWILSHYIKYNLSSK